MATGTIATIVIASIIGVFFMLGIRSIIRKFSGGAGDCCGGGCSGSCASCHAPEENKQAKTLR